jgi:hypothetical protein
MKKILLQILSVTATITVSTRCFAQGQLVYANSPTTPILLFNAATGTTTKMFGSAGTFDLGLYMGLAGSTSLAQMQLVDLVMSPNAATSTSFAAGQFSGGTVFSPGNVANTINFQAGTQYAFLIAGWTAADGSTYDQAAASGDPNAYLGISSLGFVIPTAFPLTTPNVFGTQAGQIGGFTLSKTPEPATVALGSLGAAALLLFRRANKTTAT